MNEFIEEDMSVHWCPVYQREYFKKLVERQLISL